jgi:hypothetical protein
MIKIADERNLERCRHYTKRLVKKLEGIELRERNPEGV